MLCDLETPNANRLRRHLIYTVYYYQFDIDTVKPLQIGHVYIDTRFTYV